MELKNKKIRRITVTIPSKLNKPVWKKLNEPVGKDAVALAVAHNGNSKSKRQLEVVVADDTDSFAREIRDKLGMGHKRLDVLFVPEGATIPDNDNLAFIGAVDLGVASTVYLFWEGAVA